MGEGGAVDGKGRYRRGSGLGDMESLVGGWWDC